MKTSKLSLVFTPEGPVVEKTIGNRIIVGYKTHDESCAFEPQGWSIYTARRSSSWRELQNFREALGMDENYQPSLSVVPNKYAVKLDVYQHTGTVYSISGEGIQCRFDTAKGGAVWVPDDDYAKHFDSMHAGFGAMVSDVNEACRKCLAEYNAWQNGENYGVCVEVFDVTGKRLSEDAVWGFIGSDCAEESLQRDYFIPAVAKLGRELVA